MNDPKIISHTLTNESITFGKYKGGNLTQMLRDRNYCKWLLQQDWFETNYEWLYNRVLEYEPLVYFLEVSCDSNETSDFLETYPFFSLIKPENLEIELSSVDMMCYKYYMKMIDEIKDMVYERLENDEENPYDIKAPTKWLQRFEREYGINRSDFKEFINAYELPNIPYVIERVKKEGGITYKGAQSFNIAKSRSVKQEKWWEELLKKKYGEDIGTQFKYENCIFDFINIGTRTIYECKLGLKDFDESQHEKYKLTLSAYNIIYLIAMDCIICMKDKCIHTTDPEKYQEYIYQISYLKNPSYLDLLIQDFDIIELTEQETLTQMV